MAGGLRVHGGPLLPHRAIHGLSAVGMGGDSIHHRPRDWHPDHTPGPESSMTRAQALLRKRSECPKQATAK